MTHTSGTIRTNININSILSAVLLIFITVISFFLVRLIAQLDNQETRLNTTERNVVELKGTLNALNDRTVVTDRRTENIERKLDRMWEVVKK